MPRVAVVGSVNLDLVAAAARLPLPGETLTDAVFAQHPGGKGANQALALRRLGLDVALIARVGKDAFAEPALALLRAEGVDLTRSWRDPSAPTGVALIVVGSDGENQIVVAPGANSRLSPADLQVGDVEAVVTQLEIPIETVEAVAAQATGIFCLNAAPSRPVPASVFERADVVIVNEIEHAEFGAALEACSGLVVKTMGAAGAVLYRRGREVGRVTPPPVEPVDTVGAGDAFVAAFLAGLLEKRSASYALERGCAAGALATTRPGAQPSLPTAAELNDLMSR